MFHALSNLHPRSDSKGGSFYRDLEFRYHTLHIQLHLTSRLNSTIDQTTPSVAAIRAWVPTHQEVYVIGMNSINPFHQVSACG